MSKLSVILGAGFSANAGFPLAQSVNARFNRNQIGNLLKMSSSEWLWKDGKNETTVHNGTILTEANYYSYVINEVVKDYCQQTGTFNDYEDLFQYILNNSNDKAWHKNIQEKAYQKYLIDYPHMNYPEGIKHLTFHKNNGVSRTIEIINYLIADLLFLQVPEEIIIKFYKRFVDYILQFDNVTIFTLNHDLLLEGILDLFKVKYSRGFSDKESSIYFEESPLPIFQDDFSKSRIKIIKLHGSLDYYRFQEVDNSQLSGKYNYFTTRGYRAKHYARRIDLKTGETIQDLNSDIVPKFITGKDKPEIIKNDVMYSALFSHFQNDISKTENLLISGYSFRDEHVNAELQQRNDLKVINQRRSTDYPFEGNIRNVDSFNDLF